MCDELRWAHVSAVHRRGAAEVNAKALCPALATAELAVWRNIAFQAPQPFPWLFGLDKSSLVGLTAEIKYGMARLWMERKTGLFLFFFPKHFVGFY